MYIVVIAWLYVTLLMALAEDSFAAGLVTFVFYGAFPLAILMWLLGAPARRRRRRSAGSAAPRPSVLEPDQGGHAAALGAPAKGPESFALGKGAETAAGNRQDTHGR